MLDICVCTHQPKKEILQIVIKAISEQDIGSSEFNVLIVDNGSHPPLQTTLLDDLHSRGIEARIVFEPALGIVNARRRAIEETAGDWIIFVDDDNELRTDFLSRGRLFARQHPKVGCFGGKLLLAPNIQAPEWMAPFLEFLGIRDFGHKEIISMSNRWSPAEPPTAGAWVKREVAQRYVSALQNDPRLLTLGRSGNQGLSSSEDSLMMRGATALGLANAYAPDLVLWHHLSPHRFEFGYILKLMAGYGESQLILEKNLIGEHPLEQVYEDDAAFAQLIDDIFRDKSVPGKLRIGRMMWHIAGRVAQMRYLSDNQPNTAISLVTPCLNAVETIERTILSIRAQNYPNLQYIVCDGGSTDGTLEVLNRHQDFIDVLIVGKDKNVADALNKGFVAANGEIRGYLNADDCLTPNALRHVASFFLSAPQATIITGSCRRHYADGSVVTTRVPDNFYDVMALRNDIEQPSTFWRAEIQDKCGPFDDSFKLAFDWEFWNRMKSTGAIFHKTDKLLSVYYFTENNLTSRAGSTVIEEMYRITKKYAGADIADAYMQLFNDFDMKGYYDVPFDKLPRAQQELLGSTLSDLTKRFGSQVVRSYNWNWASKQIRGVKWY